MAEPHAIAHAYAHVHTPIPTPHPHAHTLTHTYTAGSKPSAWMLVSSLAAAAARTGQGCAGTVAALVSRAAELASTGHPTTCVILLHAVVDELARS